MERFFETCSTDFWNFEVFKHVSNFHEKFDTKMAKIET